MTRNIIIEDHGNRHYMADITAIQQQFRDLRLIGELIILKE